MEIKKEETDDKITFCSQCGNVCKGKINGSFVLCERCGMWIPIGSDSFYIIKGGGNMAKQEKAKAKAEKVAEEKGPTAKEILAEKAAKINDFMKTEFADEDEAGIKKINHAYWKLFLN